MSTCSLCSALFTVNCGAYMVCMSLQRLILCVVKENEMVYKLKMNKAHRLPLSRLWLSPTKHLFSLIIQGETKSWMMQYFILVKPTDYFFILRHSHQHKNIKITNAVECVALLPHFDFWWDATETGKWHQTDSEGIFQLI